MVYVIDIDGTICTNRDGQYEKADPFPHRIRRVNELYDAGHIIKYFTARGMGRFNGDRFAAIDALYQATEDQLNSWGAKYHELILGKPSGDIYIDDKGCNSDHYFADELL